MKKLIKTLGLIILLFLSGQLKAQYNQICEINKVFSSNENYFLISIPFDNNVQQPEGKTIVYKSDSTELYQIPYYFELSKNRYELFLSNDGQTVLYIIDWAFDCCAFQNKNILIFRLGKKIKDYTLNDLIYYNPETDEPSLLYEDAIETVTWDNWIRNITFKEGTTEFEKRLIDQAIFLRNDTVVIFCKTKKVLKIDLYSGILEKNDFTSNDENYGINSDTLRIHTVKFKSPTLYGIPEIASGEKFEDGLANCLNMVALPSAYISDDYKVYSIYISVFIDTLGRATDLGILNDDSLSINKINKFVESTYFETKYIPMGIEKWEFQQYVFLKTKDKEKAKQERLEEIAEENRAYEKRLVADTINDFYIPRNIEECFNELNTLLEQKDIDGIKNLNSRDETIKFHMGLGRWLRNNWGLWCGSRLQQYFISKGLNHPDNMSGLILEFYYDWLNGDNKEWQNFENE